MPQDRYTGAVANEYGHNMAKRIAWFLRAELLNDRSNEIKLNNKRFVIKSAHRNVPQIGVSVNMLPRLDGIIAAIENENGNYSLYELDTKWYQKNMTPSRSRSQYARKVMMVSCTSVKQEGKILFESIGV